MDSYDVFASISAALADVFIDLIWFNCGWFVVDAILGPWLQTRLVRRWSAGRDAAGLRSGPLYVPHVLFSMAFMNPYSLYGSLWELPRRLDYRVLGIIILGIYVLILPGVWDCLVVLTAARWQRLRWFRQPTALKAVLPWSLLMTVFSLGGDLLQFTYAM